MKTRAGIIAGYQDLDSARHDFQTLVDAAKDKSIRTGAALIWRRRAVQFGRHQSAPGRGAVEAPGWAGTIACCQALLASAALSAWPEALAGTFAHHRIKTGT